LSAIPEQPAGGRRGARYYFRSDWTVPARPQAVFAVLARGEDYPQWWPQVREAVPDGEDAARCRFRSLLPYDLRVRVRSDRNDPEAGVLQARLAGDLRGWVRWTVIPQGDGSRIRYEQDTELCRPLLRLLSPLCRPLFRANHALMMRSARRGLGARLEVGLDGG
jgi:uncharacterized protein YndB with AHSA1/START domain